MKTKSNDIKPPISFGREVLKQVLVFLLLFNTYSGNGQHEIDYYNKNIVYHGGASLVSTEYYQPVYKHDSIIGYQAEPNGFFPHHSKKYYDKKGNLMKLEEFDSKCGLDTSCIIYNTDFTYNEGRIHEKKRYHKGVHPSTTNYSYWNRGDSIFYEKVMKSYQPYKITKRKGLLTKERLYPSDNGYVEKTILDSNDNPIKFSRYKRDRLDFTIDFSYDKNKPDFHQSVHYISSNTIISKRVIFNERGFMSKYINSSNKGSAFEKILKYKYDAHGNWVEMRMYNGEGKELMKVLQTITYW